MPCDLFSILSHFTFDIDEQETVTGSLNGLVTKFYDEEIVELVQHLKNARIVTGTKQENKHMLCPVVALTLFG
jgi:hypothetical protein